MTYFNFMYGSKWKRTLAVEKNNYLLLCNYNSVKNACLNSTYCYICEINKLQILQ